MSCCGGRPCGGPCAPKEEHEEWSRYPVVAPEPHRWAAAAPPARPQFDQAQGCCQARAGAAPFTYEDEHLAALNFPLGGFGAGQVLLQGDGTLGGWMVLNQADAKGDAAQRPTQDVPACFFAASAAVAGGAAQSFVLATPTNYTDENCRLPTYREAHVTSHAVRRLQALPGISSISVVGRYPIADVTYNIPGFPVDLSLEAMSPLVPGDARSSAFPGAVFTFTAKNTGSEAVTLRLMEGQMNFVGWDGSQAALPPAKTGFWGGNVNAPFSAGGVSGLGMSSQSVDKAAAAFGTLCVGAVEQPGSTTGVIPEAATEEELFTSFAAGAERPAGSAAAAGPSASGSSICGGVVHSVTVPAGGAASVSFVLSWHFANRLKSDGIDKFPVPDYVGAQYSNWFADAQAVAQGLAAQAPALLPATRAYRDAVFGAALPPNVIDSAAGRAALLGCPTMWWSKDGVVMGFEGNHCCPLNCSHVYGYTVLLERLFPELAQDMQFSAFSRTWADTDTGGVGVTMRYGTSGFAIDGCLASVIKTYLCVQQGDGALTWLPRVWPNVKKMMKKVTDTMVDSDGCLRGAQQNTYDSNMKGANTFIGSYYVTALRACSQMATLMKEDDLAKQYADQATLSSTSYEKICWKEAYGYYIADVTIDNCANSYGPGCFIDQLCACGLAFACGLGYLFNDAHEASARAQISKNNVVHKPPFKDFQNHFFPGDSGHVTCTYPNGKLGNGMRYDTLVSIGWNYPVIAGLLHDRNTADAEYMVDMLRTRQDGRNRSPWNEPECSNHYSRMLSGWGLYDQACGLKYDSPRQSLAFDPRYNATDFRCFFAADGGWGQYTQKGAQGLGSGVATVEALHGSFTIATLGLASSATQCTASVGGKAVAVTLAAVTGGGIALSFAAPVTLAAGSQLVCKLSGGAAEVRVPVPAAAPPCVGCRGGCGLRNRQGDAAARPDEEPEEVAKPGLARRRGVAAAAAGAALLLAFGALSAASLLVGRAGGAVA